MDNLQIFSTNLGSVSNKECPGLRSGIFDVPISSIIRYRKPKDCDSLIF